MIDIEPILRLMRREGMEASLGAITDAMIEGRISMPDDFPYPDELSDHLAELAISTEKYR